MANERITLGALVGSALLASAAAASAAPREPIIVTQMADPDPDFVPSGAEPTRRTANREEYDSLRIDQAMQVFGRALGHAALVEQQQIEAKCRQGETDTATPEQRFAFAATCRYSRH